LRGRSCPHSGRDGKRCWARPAPAMQSSSTCQ
jgi:hypothetical protein